MSRYINGAKHDLKTLYHNTRIRRIQRQKEQDMAKTTTTDDVLEVLVDAGRDTVTNVRRWGRRFIASLDEQSRDETPRRGHLRAVPDSDHPSVSGRRPSGNFSPSVRVQKTVTAANYREAQLILARDVAAELPDGYTVDVPSTTA